MFNYAYAREFKNITPRDEHAEWLKDVELKRLADLRNTAALEEAKDILTSLGIELRIIDNSEWGTCVSLRYNGKLILNEIDVDKFDNWRTE